MAPTANIFVIYLLVLLLVYYGGFLTINFHNVFFFLQNVIHSGHKIVSTFSLAICVSIAKQQWQIFLFCFYEIKYFPYLVIIFFYLQILQHDNEITKKLHSFYFQGYIIYDKRLKTKKKKKRKMKKKLKGKQIVCIIYKFYVQAKKNV